MGLFSGISKGFKALTGQTAAEQQTRAAQQAAEASRYRPINITGIPGGAQARFNFGPGGNVAGAQVVQDPRLAALSNQLAGGLGGLFQKQQQAALDPTLAQFGRQLLNRGSAAQHPADLAQLAQQEYGLLSGLLQPGREQQREEITARLLAQGRLGSGAGSDVEASLEQKFGQLDQQAALQALNNARAQQEFQQQLGLQQQQLGSGLFGSYLQQQQQPLQQNLQNLSFLQELALQPLQLGGQLGSAQSAAGANVGAALQRGAQNAAGQSIFGPGLLSGLVQGAAGPIGGALARRFF